MPFRLNIDAESKLPKYKLIRDHFKENKPVVVLVYASWCGHCNNMRSDWDQCVKTSKHAILEIENDMFSQFNKQNDDFTNLLGSIHSFPTILKIHNKKVIPYEGPRSVEGFSKLMGSKAKNQNVNMQNLLSKYVK